MAAAGVTVGRYDGIGTHALPHTAASDVLDACGHVRVAQVMLGDQNLSKKARRLRQAGLPKMRSNAMEGRTYQETTST